jgi:hypothetical protein
MNASTTSMYGPFVSRSYWLGGKDGFSHGQSILPMNSYQFCSLDPMLYQINGRSVEAVELPRLASAFHHRGRHRPYRHGAQVTSSQARLTSHLWTTLGKSNDTSSPEFHHRSTCTHNNTEVNRCGKHPHEQLRSPTLPRQQLFSRKVRLQQILEQLHLLTPASFTSCARKHIPPETKPGPDKRTPRQATPCSLHSSQCVQRWQTAARSMSRAKANAVLPPNV